MDNKNGLYNEAVQRSVGFGKLDQSSDAHWDLSSGRLPKPNHPLSSIPPLNSGRHSNLNRLSNDQLLISLEEQLLAERKTSHSILLHLKEISRRRLYAQRGFSNLREMLIKHFQQSETAANQRLKSLELMLAVPAVEERLISGDLNMSTVAMAQRQIQREEKLTGKELSNEKKAKIVESITNKTMANAEIELFKLLPETASHPATFERRVSEHATRLNLTVPNDVMEMFIRLKELWAHVDPRMDHIEVIRRSFKMTLQRIDPAQKKSSVKKRQSEVEEKNSELMQMNGQTQEQAQISKQVQTKQTQANCPAQTHGQMQAHDHVQTHGHVQIPDHSPAQDYSQIRNPSQIKHHLHTPEHDPTAGPEQPTHSLTDSVKHRGTKRPTYYRKHLDRALWQRAQFRCEYLDNKTGRRCACRFGLQREHVIPLALGGANTLSNMQLLCATHNQLRARQIFGNKKIYAFQSGRKT